MKSERIGLVVLASVLVAVALIIGVSCEYQRAARLTQIRAQGVALARLLSGMSLDRLVAPGGQQGPLQVVRSTQANPDFAYAVLVDPVGRALSEAPAAGVIVPHAPVSAEPASWFGEGKVTDPDSGRTFREFHAPVLDHGELAGYVRIGYAEPGYLQIGHDLSFFAWLALPVVLLAPLFYYLLRREMAPLRRASAQIGSMLQEQPLRRVELEARGEMGEFVRNFNRMIQAAEDRVRALETSRATVLSSSRVLSYQKARIESVLQSLPEAIIVLDETATVTFANKKLDAMVGIDHESVLGRKPEEWCESPELSDFLAQFYRHTARRNEGGRIEISPAHTPGRQVGVTAYPLFSPKDGSSIYGTLVVFHDETAEVLARQARQDFVAHLSHELKTPLHVIGMYGEMLLEKGDKGEEVRIEAANVIHDEVERLATLIGDMLNIARIEMGGLSVERARTRLRDLLADVFETAARNGKDREIEFRLNLPPEMSAVNVDKDLLRVALNNLLGNAVKYNRPGGEVELSATEDDEEIAITVRDSGIGIPAEDQPRIFEKFFRSPDAVRSAATGQGLGLTLAREIVTMHQGDLTVQSALDQGSEFRITLKKSPILLREAV